MSKIDVLGVSSCLKTLNKFYLLYIPKYYVLQMSQEIDNFIQSLNEDGTSASDVSEMIPQKHHVPQPPFVALPAPQFHIPEMLTSCWKPIDPSNPCPLLQRVTMHPRSRFKSQWLLQTLKLNLIRISLEGISKAWEKTQIHKIVVKLI